MEKAFAELSASAATEQKSEISPVVEAPFVMPSADLPVKDQFPPSRFDSVSIMEKSAPEAEKASEVAEIIPEAAPPIPVVPVVIEEKNAFTQPNLVGSDTGGKNKKKTQNA